MNTGKVVAAWVAGAAALTFALGATYGTFALLAPVEPITPQLVAVESVSTPLAEVSFPTYGASAIGDAESDHLFAGVDVDTPRPIASLTKVVTALVVLDSFPIDEGTDGATITLTNRDSELVARYAAMGGTTAPAPAGRTITQRQVIELMMVHSANNYAESLAVWAFGSVDDYLVAARAWLDDQGLSGITVADTTGFSEDNRASPRTLLRLARIAVADPVVSAASALPSLTVPGVGTYANRNLIVGFDGVTGLKTGTLDASGACLLFSAQHAGPTGEHSVAGVVLGGPQHPRVAADARALIESVRDDYHAVTLLEQGTVLARYTSPWGETAELRVAETVDDLVWGQMSAVTAVRAPSLQPGVTADTSAVAEIRYAGEKVRVPVEWVGTIGQPPLDWRLAQPLAEFVDAVSAD